MRLGSMVSLNQNKGGCCPSAYVFILWSLYGLHKASYANWIHNNVHYTCICV